jgi:hypothetical protein
MKNWVLFEHEDGEGIVPRNVGIHSEDCRVLQP